MLISSVWRGVGRWYFVSGLLFGGAVAAVAASLLGTMTVQWWLSSEASGGISVAIILLVSVMSPVLLDLSWAQNRRQVPEQIRRLGPRTGGFQFGFEMGTASRTFMPTTMPHALLLGLVTVISLPWAVVVGAAFGAGRAAVPLLRSYDAEDIEWSLEFDRWGKLIWITMVASSTASALALTLIDLRA